MYNKDRNPDLAADDNLYPDFQRMCMMAEAFYIPKEEREEYICTVFGLWHEMTLKETSAKVFDLYFAGTIHGEEKMCTVL